MRCYDTGTEDLQMPKFAANLTMLFNEVPFLDRFGAAAECGFQGVEFLFPYEHSADAIGEKLCEHKLELALFNMPPGNFGGGDRGLACIPGREAEFRAALDLALTYAIPLKVPRLHVMAGIAPPSADPAGCRATLIANLRYAAEQLAPHGIIAMLEAINDRDIPGFFVNTQADSHAICQAAETPNIQMQMDLYHMQMMEGDVANKLRKYARHCGHIQIAGAPGRNEPDTGELRYEYLFQVLDEAGYAGWVGCEYRPAGSTVDGLGWYRNLFTR